MEISVNWLAILIAVVVQFFIGFLWYGPLFGKAWAKELGIDMTQKPDQSVMIKGMAFMVIGNLLTAWVLANNIVAWGHVPGILEMGKFSNVLTTAIFTCLGFYVPYHLGAIAWQKQSWTFFGINISYALVSLLVVSAILIYMN